MENQISISLNLPSEAYDGTLTFVGVLRRYFVDYDEFGNNNGISKYYNDNTKKAYLSDYENRLLPAIAKLYGKEKPMHSYTAEEFENILDFLNQQNHYADNTKLHYRHLLWTVYRIGFERKLYEDNIFWDDIIGFLENDSEKQESHRAAAMTRIRKSFSISEEYRIMQWFKSLNPKTASGEDIGLLLMFLQGIRGNEACGTTFGNIRSLYSYPDTPVLDIVQTTMIDSNKLKAGGKTKNAPRTLPLFLPLSEFLMQRRTYLLALVESGELILPPEIKSVDHLPIVCMKHNFTERASTRNLTEAGRELFNDIGVEKSELALLYQIMFSHEFKESPLDEKEPTTYLFRRNCATHLYQLGFASAEIQYWLGHDIEDPHISRNSFADEDVLYHLSQMFQYHPLYAMLNVLPETTVTLDDKPYSGSTSGTLKLNLKGDCSQLLIDLKANEPNQSIRINISTINSTIDGSVDVAAMPKEYPRTVDIRNLQYNAYKKGTKHRNQI